MIPAAEFDALVQQEFGTRLEERGFDRINRRTWVRSAKVPIREVIGIGSLKGDTFMPGWSISLDFVPHVTTAGRIAWHRTAKQHHADLGINAADDPKRLPADQLAVSG